MDCLWSFSEPLLPTFLSSPGSSVSRGNVQLRLCGRNCDQSLGGECLGLTPRGTETPLPSPKASPPAPEPWEEPCQAPHGWPLWASAGPAPFCDFSVNQSGNSGCPSWLWQPPASNRGPQEQRQTQEAASLAPSSHDLTGAEGPPGILSYSLQRRPLFIPSVSGACCPQAVAWPWPPRGLGLTASPSLGSAPCPLPCQPPPQSSQ